MSETLRFFSAQISLLAVVLILHTYIGLHVIRRTLIFSDLVLDQLAAFGALVGIGLAVQYGTAGSYLFSLGAVLVGALALAVFKPRTPGVPREAAIGILYAMALAGSLLLGDKLSGGAAHVTKTLSGSMLWVSWPIVGITAAVYAVLLVFHLIYRARFIALAEGRSTVERRRRWWDFLFFTTQGIITVLIVPIAGVLLAFALLMIPAAIAAIFTRRWGPAVLIGWSVGMVACVSGVFLSFFRDLPYGPTLILCLGAAFLIAVALRIAVPSASRS
jgi:zinc/manganese transport system permease protein